jgi:hypothetical protein
MSIRRLAQFVGALFCVPTLCVTAAAVAPGTAALASTPALAPSVGAYPTVIRFDQALRGGEYLDTFGVINSTGSGESFTFGLAGTTAPWVHVVSSGDHAMGIKKVWAPSGPRPSTAVLELQVPATLANGVYRGELTISSAPPKVTKNGQTPVGLGAAIGVVVDVTGTEVVAGDLVNAYTTYPKVEVGSPVNVFVVVKNGGNVAQQPGFALKVTKSHNQNAQYDWQGTTGPALLPNQTAVYEVAWPGASTETQTLGAYSATIDVAFGRKHIGTADLNFQLVPYGSLHRGGKLLNIKLSNHPQAGFPAAVQAQVKSTGEVQQQTSFVGQLYRNGRLVEGIKSPVPILLQPGQDGTITMPVPVTKNGEYKLSGTANFGGAQSNPETLTFRVGPAPIPLIYEIGAGLVVVLLVALVVAAVLWRRRRPGPPSWPERGHAPRRYPSSHSSTLHVPPRTPVGSSGSRQQRAGPS